jgi:hypothetical protein
MLKPGQNKIARTNDYVDMCVSGLNIGITLIATGGGI